MSIDNFFWTNITSTDPIGLFVKKCPRAFYPANGSFSKFPSVPVLSTGICSLLQAVEVLFGHWKVTLGLCSKPKSPALLCFSLNGNHSTLLLALVILLSLFSSSLCPFLGTFCSPPVWVVLWRRHKRGQGAPEQTWEDRNCPGRCLFLPELYCTFSDPSDEQNLSSSLGKRDFCRLWNLVSY